MATSTVLGFYPGLTQPNIYPMTFSGIQQACNDVGIGGQVYVGPGNVTGWGTLTLYGHTSLICSGTSSTIFTSSSAATGPAIREKTAGEGNTSGASGIILEKFSVYGNGSTFDGIDMGNQGGAQFTSNATMVDLLVRDFNSGNGYKINANAIHCRNIWAIACSVGVYLNSGGASQYSGIWGEACTDVEVRVNCFGNTFDFLQLEHNGTVATNGMLEFTGGNATFNSVKALYMSLSGNAGDLVVEKSGVVGTCYGPINVASNGFTWAKTIKHAAFPTVGPTASFVPWYYDDTAAASGTFYNSSTGLESQINGTTFSPQAVNVAGALTVGTTSLLKGNVTAGVAGSGFLAVLGQGAVDASSSSLKLQSGTTGESDLYFNQNGTDYSKFFMTSTDCFHDVRGNMTWRAGLGGANMLKLTPAGALNMTAVLFANLGTPANGTVVYCSDATSPSNPTTGGGTGGFTVRQNGAWKTL